MCYHSRQRSTFWESMVLSGGHVPSLQLLNGAGNYAHLQELKKKREKSINVSQWKRTDLCLLSVYEQDLRRLMMLQTWWIKTTQSKPYAHAVDISSINHLQNANGNLSFQTHKCRNSITGQSSITLQSSSVWIMVTVTAHCCNSKAQLSITGQCLPLKQHG